MVRNVSKKRTLRRFLTRAMGVFLSLALAVPLFSGLGGVSAVTSLPHVENIKDTKPVVRILELAPQTSFGVIGYFANGQEPVSSWRDTLATKTSRTARQQFFSDPTTNSVFTQLKTANLLSDGNTTPITLAGASGYAEIYPWEYAAGGYETYSKLNLSATESVTVQGSFSEPGDKNSGPYNVNYSYAVDLDNPGFLQSFTNLVPLAPSEFKTSRDSYYYDFNFIPLPEELTDLPDGTPVFTAVFEATPEGEEPPEQPLHYQLHGIRGAADFPGLDMDETYYIIAQVKQVYDFASVQNVSDYVYQATGDGFIQKPDPEMVELNGEAVELFNPLAALACFRRQVDGYTWRGYSRNNEPLGNTTGTVGTGESTTLYYNSVYYSGGYVNNDWLLTYALDATALERANTSVVVTTVTPGTMPSGADLPAFLSQFDLLVLSPGLDISNPSRAPEYSIDLSADKALALAGCCANTSAIPVLLDYRLTGCAKENIRKLARTLYAAAQEQTLNTQSITSLSDSFTAPAEKDASFISGSLYCYQPTAIYPYLPCGSSFHTLELDSVYNPAGFDDLVDEVAYENFLRKQQTPETTDLLSDKVTTATCLRYILNYGGRRIVNKATQIRVLEIQPSYGSELTLDKKPGGQPDEDLIREWFGLQGTSIPVTLTTMTTSEYIGKINDINEDYDVVYIGASLGNLNTQTIVDPESPDPRNPKYITLTDYNDNDMDGLLYTNIGDLYSSNSTLSGLLDRDYVSGDGENDVFSATVNGSNYSLHKINTSAATTTFRFSGNDLTAAKVRELTNFANAGYPVILSDELLKGSPAVSASLDYHVDVTKGAVETSGVRLKAEAAFDDSLDGLDASFQYTWRDRNDAAWSSSGQDLLGVVGHTYYCEVSVTGDHIVQDATQYARSKDFRVFSDTAMVVKVAEGQNGSYRYSAGGVTSADLDYDLEATLSYIKDRNILTVTPYLTGNAPLPAGYRYDFQWKYFESRNNIINITESNRGDYDISSLAETDSSSTLTFNYVRYGPIFCCEVSVIDIAKNKVISTATSNWFIIGYVEYHYGHGGHVYYDSSQELNFGKEDGELKLTSNSGSYKLSATSSYALDGSQAKLTAVANLTPDQPDVSLSYQWYRDNGSSPDTKLEDEDSEQYTFTITDETEGTYYCRVTTPDGQFVETKSITVNKIAEAAVELDATTDWDVYKDRGTVSVKQTEYGDYTNWKDNFNFNDYKYIKLSSKDFDNGNRRVYYFNNTLSRGDYTVKASINPSNDYDVTFFASHSDLNAINSITATASKDNSNWNYQEVSFPLSITTDTDTVNICFKINKKGKPFYVKDIAIMKNASYTASGGGKGNEISVTGTLGQNYSANMTYSTSGSEVTFQVTPSLTEEQLGSGFSYAYAWTLNPGVNPPENELDNRTFTATDTETQYSCSVRVVKTSDATLTCVPAKTQTYSIKKACDAQPTGSAREGKIAYSRASSYEVESNRVDMNSQVYKLLTSIQDKGNVMTVKEATNDTATSMIYLNFSKPTLHVTSSPMVYNGTDTSAAMSGRTLSYTFSISNPTDATPSETTYDVRLYIDMNADGRFTDADEGSEKLADILVYRVDAGGGLSPVYPNGSGNFALRAGTEYCVKREMPSDYWGILPWKLEVVKTGASYIHASASDFTRISSGSDKVQIHVLQIRHKSGEGVDLKNDFGFNNLYKQIPDFDLIVHTIGANNLNSKNSWPVVDPTNQPTTLSEFLDQYDMLVLGFADMYSEISLSAAKAILAFAEEKSVLFTHDTTSVVNLPFKKYAASSGFVDRADFWGYNFNSILRDAVSLDRYGVTNPTYGQTKYSPLNSKTVSGIVAGSTYTSLSATQAAELEEAGYSVAYKPTKSADKVNRKVGEVQGYTKLALTRNTDFSGTYSLQPTDNDYKENNQNTTTQVVSQVNKGQITTYPFNINTTAFLTAEEENALGDKAVGKYVNVKETHEQYYQLNMNSDDIVVWYCLASDGSSPYSWTPNDVVNSYYIYSVGNITYSGAGHSDLSTSKPEEAKLFINTMIAAYRTKNAPAAVTFTDVKGNPTQTKLFGVDTITNEPVSDDSDALALYFRVNDLNLTTKKKTITVKVEIDNGDNTMVEYHVPISRGDGTQICDNNQENDYSLSSGVPYKFTLPDTVMESLLTEHKQNIASLSNKNVKRTVRITVSTVIGNKPPLVSAPIEMEVRVFSLMPLG